MGKVCSVCRGDYCNAGQYLKIPDNPLRQRWVCNKCIARTTSPIVLANLENGTLSGAEVQRARRGDTCPIGCPKASPTGCPASLLE